VWLAAPGTDDVKAQFAFMGFRAAVNLAARRVESLREEFELLNHGVQVREHTVLRRKGHARYIGHDRSLGRHLVQALPDNLHTLLHILDSDPVSVVGVAVLASAHAQFAAGIGRVRLSVPYTP